MTTIETETTDPLLSDGSSPVHLICDRSGVESKSFCHFVVTRLMEDADARICAMCQHVADATPLTLCPFDKEPCECLVQ